MKVCRRQFCASLLGGALGRLRALPPRPKLTVLLILEQFRPEYLEAARLQLTAGGLRRLMEKGAFFPDCRHLASTFPSSTIATLATGAWPGQHGIVADTWYDRSLREPVTASDEDLTATTLAAQIAADPRARVSVIAMSLGHATLFGANADARLFWMDDTGQFVTAGTPPDWLTTFNSQKTAESLRNTKWLAVGAKLESPALRTLTYDPERPEEFITLYRSSPYGQRAQFDLLSELILRGNLGQESVSDFVCVVLESTALLGYDTGGRSPLMQQMILHLDQRLEALFAQLSKTPGENAFNIILAGAHGAPPEPQEDARSRMMVHGESVAQAIDKSLVSAGIGRVEKFIYPFVYIDPGGSRDPEPIRIAAARAAIRHPAVQDFYTAGGACSSQNAWRERFRNSFHYTRSGDIMLAYKPEYVEDYGEGRGISYGSLYNYDVRVPLCFFGPQFKAGVHESPVEAVDVAPTLARALGVSVPSSSVGRVLGEAFTE